MLPPNHTAIGLIEKEINKLQEQISTYDSYLEKYSVNSIKRIEASKRVHDLKVLPAAKIESLKATLLLLKKQQDYKLIDQ